VLKHNKILKKISLSIATLLVAVLFLSCEQSNIETIRSFSHPQGAPSVKVLNTEIMYSDSAAIQFILKAPELNIYDENKDPYTEFPKGFTITQYNNSKNNISSILKADYGKYFENKSLWEARQNVIAVTQTGDTLFTDILFWNEEKDIIYSDQFVKIVQKERVISGIGFESDLQMENWEIKENVSGSIVIEVEE
jgi:LPS export ABC transporter protein LptC